MPYRKPPDGQPQQTCVVCEAPANVQTGMMMYNVECTRCGDFAVERVAVDDHTPIRNLKVRALASHLIRKLQASKRPTLTGEFFNSLPNHRLPSPSEMSDNLLLLIDKRVDGRPGAPVSIDHSNDFSLQATIGAIDGEDALWAVRTLHEEALIDGSWQGYFTNGHVTASGWQRIEELKRAHISSRYAFFARQFKNDDLDKLFEDCLKKAVAEAMNFAPLHKRRATSTRSLKMKYGVAAF